MTTEWKYRMFLFIPPGLNEGQKTAIAAIFTNNGGLQSVQEERRMFDAPVQLSTSGGSPAELFGFNTAAKTPMKDGLIGALSVLAGAVYYCVTAVDFDDKIKGTLVATNWTATLGRSPFTWEDALGDLGMMEIDPLAEVAFVAELTPFEMAMSITPEPFTIHKKAGALIRTATNKVKSLIRERV